jgi:hypothetical protein
LAGVNVPLRDTLLPTQVAGSLGGAHHELAEGEHSFRFQRPQRVGTVIVITLERWDHGLRTSDETLLGGADTNDGSGSAAAPYDDVSGKGNVSDIAYMVQDCSMP